MIQPYSMKLLYIEDELTIAEPVIRILEKKGFEIDYSENGTSGLEMAVTNNYDCLILDLNLPEIDGLKIAKEIRLREIETPILMLTARTTLEDKLIGFETGTDDYLTKPFEILELIARVNALIKRKSENKTIELTIGEYMVNVDQNIIHTAQNSKHI